MKIKIQVIFEYENSRNITTQETACLTGDELLTESLALTLAKRKDLLPKMQKQMVYHHVTEYIKQHRCFAHCGSAHSLKKSKTILFRTPR